MKDSDKINLILFLVICIIVYLFLVRNNVIEGFSDGIDTQALTSIASIYNNQNLTIDNLKVTGNIEVDGYAKAKAFALTGHEYSDAEAKAIQPDGIFYRTSGQAAIGMDDNLYIRDIRRNKTVTINSGNLTVPGKLTVQGGSDFSGGRHYFKDSEKSDGTGLRVGAAWGKYGIYSENGPLVLGSKSSWVDTGSNQNLHVGSGRLVNKSADVVRYGESLEARPNNDGGKCFDFGSKGRTQCSNGWSIVKLNKR